MAKATAYIGGKYITKEMVEAMDAKERRCIIDHVSEETISGVRKLVVYFENHEFGLPLNTTRIETLIEVHGGVEETDDWRGTEIMLGVDPTIRFQGKRVGGVTLEPIPKK